MNFGLSPDKRVYARGKIVVTTHDGIFLSFGSNRMLVVALRKKPDEI
jgi:predicted RNA-binding protein (virulence factor B family)